MIDSIARSQQARMATAFATSFAQAQAQQAVESILQTQDYARLAIGESVAAAVANLNFLGQRLSVESTFAASLITRPWLTATAQIQEVLRGWTRSAQIAESLTSIGRTLAGLPVVAALAARRAALRGDVQAVRGFILHWLDRTPTEPVVEATITALLDDDWLPRGPLLTDDPNEVIAHLRSRTTDRHTRRYKMIGHTQIEGRLVTSLDRPVLGPSGEPTPLGHLVADRYVFGDHSGVFKNPHARRAFALLSPEERAVVLAWSPELTWGQAAVRAGQPESLGETVRRKRKRIQAEVLRRLESVGSAHPCFGT